MKAILVIFHCESNTGYAIERLESVFFDMALELMGGDVARVHFGYPEMRRGAPRSLPPEFAQYTVVDCSDGSPSSINRTVSYIRSNHIDTVFGFDQPATFPLYKHLRQAGVKTFVSYWGAPMSSIFGPVKRTLKRIEMRIRRHGPDHYIFESQGMADTAVLGRGIPRHRVSVVPLGVNTELYRPSDDDIDYVYRTFSIPLTRKVFVFSGHMEPRKGVHIILRAAKLLLHQHRRDDWHILLLGALGPDRDRLFAEIGDDPVGGYVTFGGYRNDIPQIHRGCYAGIIASTGWDSLTMSSMEMQSSGLPLLVSDLRGLREAIANGETGFLFPVGNPDALALQMASLLDDRETRNTLSRNARARIRQHFSRGAQVVGLASLVRTVAQKSG